MISIGQFYHNTITLFWYYNMFFTSSTSQLHTLAHKKTLFQKQIRKDLQQQLFSELREQAHMPEHIAQSIAQLPHSFQYLIKIVNEQGKMPSSWVKAISAGLYRVVERNPEWMSTLPPNQCVHLLLVIMGDQPFTYCQFDSIWQNVLMLCPKWSIQQRNQLLNPLTLAIRNIDIKYLSSAHDLISKKQPRFDDINLDFYNNLLLHCPVEAFQVGVLSQSLFELLIVHLKMRFYADSELIKMCEILIQVLYLSTEQFVAEKWQIDKLFTVLQFFIKNSSCNLLIDRSLLLIYNVNIDVGSKIFLSHTCVETIADQIVNSDFPLKLRELMAETYLSAIANTPPAYMGRFVQQKHELICQMLQKILQEFKQNQYLMNSMEVMLNVMLNCSTEEQILLFRKLLKNNVPLMEAIREVSFGTRLIEEWELL